MEQSKLPYREERISPGEKRTLVRRFIGVLFFGGLIGYIAFYFLFVWDGFRDMQVPVIVFAVFFFGILGFILFIHGRNAFQRNKRVYTGTVTGKEEEVSKFRDSPGQSTYTVFLDGEAFRVELNFYNQVQKGRRVELHCLKKKQVFLVKQLDAGAPQAAAQEMVYPRQSTLPVEKDYAAVLKVAVRRAVVFRSLLLLLPLCLLYFAATIALILGQDDAGTFLVIHWVLLAFFVALYVLFNLKTIRLARDLISGALSERNEKVIDLQSSNLPKPGKNSVTYPGYWYRNDVFYYLQTEKHWIQVPEELYRQLSSGDSVSITTGKYSGLVLDVRKTKI